MYRLYSDRGCVCFLAAMSDTVDVTSSDCSFSGTSAGRRPSDAAGASAVGDSAGAQRRPKKPTMRMPKVRGTALAALRGSDGIQNSSEPQPKRKIRILKKKASAHGGGSGAAARSGSWRIRRQRKPAFRRRITREPAAVV